MTYFVKTTDGRVTVVEADSYSTEFGLISFHKQAESGKLVAVGTFPVSSVFSMIEDNAYKGNFDPDEDEDETDDVCLDCRIKDVVKTDEFFEAVWDIVDAYHDDGDEQVSEAPQQEYPDPETSPTEPEPRFTEPEPKVQRRKPLKGIPTWGFVAEGKFVPFGDGDYGKESAERNQNTSPDNWSSYPLEETVPAPEVN